MKFMLSEGHSEYVLHGTGVVVTTVWCPWGDDGEDLIEIPEGGEIDGAVWERVTGLPASDMPDDVDFGWETIVTIEGESDAIGAALDTLITDLREDPGGDDGTFDYWPSGVRMALAIDRHLGHERHDAIADAVHTVIGMQERRLYAPELYNKVDLPIPPEYGAPTALVWVVVSLKDGNVTDLEILDQPPAWDLAAYGQECYMGCINGGDSRRFHPDPRNFPKGDHS